MSKASKTPSPDKRNRLQDNDVLAVRSLKRINNKRFRDKIKSTKLFVDSLLKIAPEVAKLKDPYRQYIQFDEATFTKKDGKDIQFEAQRLTEADYRGLLVRLDRDFAQLAKMYQEKNSRNSFKVSQFFKEENRFDNWFKYLNAQNRLVQAGDVITRWIENENFGAMRAPQIDEDGRVTANVQLVDSNELRNALSRQLKEGKGIRSIFGLLFFHAIRVAVVRSRTGDDEVGGHNSDDNRQNFFTQAMLDAFVDGPAPLHSYELVTVGGESFYEKVPNKRPAQSTVRHLLSGRYADDNEIVYKDVDGKQTGQSSRRLSEDFVHMTAVQTILNLNISTEQLDGSKREYEIAVKDYENATIARDALRSAFDAQAKKKNREKRSK